jgi:hypothetical protein
MGYTSDYYIKEFENKIYTLYKGRITLIGEYKNRHVKTLLSCKEHGGEITVRPKDLPKQPCPICRENGLSDKYRTDFKNSLNKLHGDQIKLAGEYKNGRTKTLLICKKHGEFEAIPTDMFSNKYPCPSCRIEHGFMQSKSEQGVIANGLNNDELIQKSIELFGDKYDYSKFNYTNKRNKIIFICKEHGEFEQTYQSHIMGFQGCKKCGKHDKTVFNKEMLGHNLYLNLRGNIYRSLKELGIEYKKYDPNYSSIKICGLKKEDFIDYLESKMEPWLSLSDYGFHTRRHNYGWDLDHIIPTNTVKTMDDFYKVYHYTNIQPLCSHTNRDLKSSKILE